MVFSFRFSVRQLADGAWLVGAARIDNRVVLREMLRVEQSTQTVLSDLDLVGHAYVRWGEHCVEHLLGDWAFAIWQPTERRLFLARDQFGIASLYYHISDDFVAFATRRKLLLSLDPQLAQIDDLYVAQLLLSWKIASGERTPHRRIRCLLPAHSLTVTDSGATNIRCYWQMATAVKPLSCSTIAEAAEGMLVHFDEAVRCRLVLAIRWPQHLAED